MDLYDGLTVGEYVNAGLPIDLPRDNLFYGNDMAVKFLKDDRGEIY